MPKTHSTSPRRASREAGVPLQPRQPSSPTDFWISLLLLAATILVYSQAFHFDFLNFDDPDYVTANQHVRRGLTMDGAAWAFGSGEDANWFPLTRLSHMLDVQLFGVRSGMHHLTNVLLHALATLILFAFLNLATRARWPSAFVALVFALHPLHIESVAWVSERKDVLCAVFWFLALWAYIRYTQKPGGGRYVLVLIAFVFGLMSKPMIVSLPFVLLLLDSWPLRRQWTTRLLVEKAPFFALSAAAGIVTYLVQRRSGAVEALTIHPLGIRIENALVSFVVYITKFFWPSRLAVFYPYPSEIPAWEVLFSAGILLAISLLVLRSRRTHPYLTAGWLWFLGTLVPVIGIVQVGAQSHADRYMYVPMVGLLIMLAWGAADLLRHRPRARTAVRFAAAAACCVLTAATLVQLNYWTNSESLFEHAIAVTNNNSVAEHNLGNALLDVPGRLPDATAHLQSALRINPGSGRAHTDLGIAYSRLPGHERQAIEQFQAAVRILPDSPVPHNDLGNALSNEAGSLPQAIVEYQAALRLKPDYAEAHNNLGSALSRMGRLEDAAAEFQAALQIDPGYKEARANLERLKAGARPAPDVAPGDPASEYRAALKTDPNSAVLHYNLAVVLSRTQAQFPEAIGQFEAALRINPDYPEAHNNLGVVLSQIPGRTHQAVLHFETALRLRPDYADAHYNLGLALANSGRFAQALTHLEAAERLRPDPRTRQTIAQVRSAMR